MRLRRKEIAMADSGIYARVKSDFDQKRSAAAAARRARIDKVRKDYPEIARIDSESARLGIENIMAIAKEPKRADEFNRALKDKFRVLEARKKEIIRRSDIQKNYEEVLYSCSKCSDTGYDGNGHRCYCFIQAIADAGFPKDMSILKRECFDNFNLEFYPPEKRAGMERILGRAKRLCKNFDRETKGLLFIGAPGLGKTFLSNCIEGELRSLCKTVLSVRAVKLFRLMEDIKFGREDDGEKERSVYDTDLLIIDDLGTEGDSQLNSSFFDSILNERINLGKKTLISTNYSMEELHKRYSSRFISRLTEYFIICRFSGNDIRMIKL